MTAPGLATVGIELLPLSAATYQPHAMHSDEQVWSQTNCSVDVWIEVLHALGLDPVAAAAFAVATDFDGDQWRFYKYPSEDLRHTYGIQVFEMNPWKGVLEHICGQLALGRLMTVEVDAWFLPDTDGVSYRTSHVKTTIVANHVDVEQRRLGYFHNSAYHELSDDDFDGLFHRRGETHLEMTPYTELIRLDELRSPTAQELADTGRRLLGKHLARRPADNPVRRMAALVETELDWLRASPAERFHEFAFVTVRQCGASAQTASTFCRWLADAHPEIAPALRRSAAAWAELAQGAKSLQLKLARVAHGRTSSLTESWDAMADQWDLAQSALDTLAPSP